MLLVFEHKYVGASDVQHDYYCNIYDKFLPADKQSVGYCKYYKNYFLDKEVYIEFLYINEDYRYKGYATAMVHLIWAILVDTILSSSGLPPTITKRIGVILMDSHHTRFMQSDAYRSIAQNFRIGIITNLATFTISLTTNHRNRFRVNQIYHL